MTRAAIAAFVLCWSLSARAMAQTQSSTPASELSFGAGATHDDRIDGVVSPARFAGPGGNVELGYARFANHFMWRAWGQGGLHSLGSSSARASSERATEGSLGLAVFSGSAAKAADDGVRFGLDFRAKGELLSHRYVALESTTESYLSGLATIGPAVLASRRFGGARLTAGLAVPLAGVAARPYSPARLGRSATDFRFATVGSLRAADAVVAYEPSVARRLGLRYEYRLGFMRYDGLQPARSLSQSISIAIVRRRAQ